MAATAERQSFPAGYTRPRVWTPPEEGPNKPGMNQVTAGPRFEEALPRGAHDLQIYALATPNGKKVNTLLEELGVEYDAWIINFRELKQFSSGFTEVNPNGKIPAMYDYSDIDPETGKPLRLFESGAILLYLADKYKKFVPPVDQPFQRQECINWLFWQTGTGPYMGGMFGHFIASCPDEIQYCIDRSTMEVKRELDMLDKHFGGEDRYFYKEGEDKAARKTRDYILGDEYSIADIMIFFWTQGMRDGYKAPGGQTAGEFLDFKSYTHVNAWLERMEARPGVKRGQTVNSMTLPNRHEKISD